MLYGITDIGSNTIRLKIYQYENNKVQELFSKKKTAGLIAYRENGKLNDEGIDILISTLKKFNKYIKNLNVDKICFFATASLRNINNSKETLDKVEKETGIRIKILSSKREAELSFISVKNDELENKEGVLIDVGGGSSEITIFEKWKPVDETSLPIGSLYCYEEYVSQMLPTKEERAKIEERVLDELKKSGIKQYNKKCLYGVGGTVRTIKKLLEHLEIKTNKNKVMPINLLDQLLDELNENTKECYNKILKVKPDRIHTIVPGILIVKTISNYFNVEQIHVTQDSLREGVLYSLIKNEEI